LGFSTGSGEAAAFAVCGSSLGCTDVDCFERTAFGDYFSLKGYFTGEGFSVEDACLFNNVAFGLFPSAV
jgi:hypothetical protein